MQGQLLRSRYRILQYLAKGGFGKTYLAEDILLPGDNRCVVKQLYPAVDSPKILEIARRLFKKEAEALRKLGNYDQIPQLLAYFEEKQKFYLVQQYIDGHTLKKELVPGQTWTEAKVIEFCQDCLQILDFIHTQGIIHRDVKPDNLIRRRQDNKLVLVDFGTVKEVISAQTQMIPSTVAVGTKGYMPTEQAMGKPRINSDIYALGIICIQALTGVHPIKFQEDENGDILWQSQANVSPQLAAILSKMVRYHFKDRYQSATEVLRELNCLGSNPSVVPISRGVTQTVQYTPTTQLNSSEFKHSAFASTRNQSKPANLSSINNSSNAQSSPPLPNTTAQSLTSKTSSSLEDSQALEKTSRNVPLTDTQSKSVSQQNSTPPSKSDRSQSSKNSQINFFSKLSNFIKSSTVATVGVAVIIGAMATGGMYLFKQQTEKEVEKILSELNNLYAKQKYQECYDQAENKKTQEAGVSDQIIQEWINKCGLGVAQRKAEIYDYALAIEIAKKLNNVTNSQEIKQHIDDWSNKILEIATATYEEKGNLEEAVQMILTTIPEDSAVRKKALDLKQTWEIENETNKKLISTANKALEEKRWQEAKSEAEKVSGSDYWKQQAKAVIDEAEKAIESSILPKSQPTTPIPNSSNQNRASTSHQNSNQTNSSRVVTPIPKQPDITPSEQLKPQSGIMPLDKFVDPSPNNTPGEDSDWAL
ncbi:protein kinase [Pleurocapsales cyanobacterium LEGE 06147]|nr:protein kinase [Pleurocapsales cyanobacterium LEGE 06147]